MMGCENLLRNFLKALSKVSLNSPGLCLMSLNAKARFSMVSLVSYGLSINRILTLNHVINVNVGKFI